VASVIAATAFHITSGNASCRMPGAFPQPEETLPELLGARWCAGGELDGAANVRLTVALDATSLLVAEYLALRHEGAPARARRDFGLAVRTVSEWFPVRALAMDAVLAAGEGTEVGSLASLALAKSLRVPLITKDHELASSRVRLLHC